MKKILFLSIIILSTSFLKAQKKGDYLIKGKDTVWCASVDEKKIPPRAFTTDDVTLNISYVDLQGEAHEIVNAEKSGITGFSRSGVNYMYFKNNEKHAKSLYSYKYSRPPFFYWKKISGSVTLFAKIGDESPASYYVAGLPDVKIIMLPDGNSIDLSDRDNFDELETKLNPLFKLCPVLRESISKKIKFSDLEYIADLYNSFCGKDDVRFRDYIVRNKKDTTYVKALQYDRDMGNVRTIAYFDESGKQQILKGREACEEITSFSYNGYVYKLVPINANKPDAYKTHVWRKTNGKIKLYEYASLSASNTWTEINEFEMPNGQMYKLNKKNVNDIIKPVLLGCPEFKKKYQGEFSTETKDVTQMIKLYDTFCK